MWFAGKRYHGIGHQGPIEIGIQGLSASVLRGGVAVQHLQIVGPLKWRRIFGVPPTDESLDLFKGFVAVLLERTRKGARYGADVIGVRLRQIRFTFVMARGSPETVRLRIGD